MASKLSKIYFLICNKFGSTDNTAAVKNLDETQGDEGVGRVQPQSSPRYGCDNDCSAAANSSAGAGPPSFRDNTPDYTQAPAFDALVHEIQELREDQSQLEEYFENVKDYYQRDYTAVLEDLQEEYRCEQRSDLRELYQNEILSVKEELASTEDKIAYQSHKSATDIHEVLEACHTRLFKLEQQQQVVELEGLHNVTAWTLFGKLINFLLAVMAVLLVCMSTCVVPLMRTRSCTLSTLLFVLSSFLWRHWDAILDNLLYLVCTKCPERGDDQ